MKVQAAIVDLGRGPQLAGTRITVQDLFPYLQAGYSPEEIAQVMPVTAEEIAAVRQYIDDHHDEVLETDRRIRERNATRGNTLEVAEILRQARAERLRRMAPGSKEAVLKHFAVFRDDNDLEVRLADACARRENSG